MPFVTSLRLLILGATAGLILTGCTGANTPSSTSSQPEASRTVHTDIGDVTVPTEIDSVVVLEGRRDLDIVLSLGLPLTGYPDQERDSRDLESPLNNELEQAKAAGAEPIFLDDEINIEAIVAKAPDLIITRDEETEGILDKLQQIAPVLIIGDQDSSSWQDDLRLVAQATGTEDKAKQIIDNYEASVAALTKKYNELGGKHIFAPIGYDSEKVEIRGGRLLSTVLQDVGVTPSQAFQQAIDNSEATFSPEELLSAGEDATALVMLVNDAADWEALQNNHLYQMLPAVQAGQVVRSDRQTHEGAGLTALHCLKVLDELLETL